MINENLNWRDHSTSLQQKVTRRLSLIKRVSYLIPKAQQFTLVETMIVSLFDYGDVVWGDRNNQSLMKTLQIVHNKCAQLVCNEIKRF